MRFLYYSGRILSNDLVDSIPLLRDMAVDCAESDADVTVSYDDALVEWIASPCLPMNFERLFHINSNINGHAFFDPVISQHMAAGNASTVDVYGVLTHDIQQFVGGP